MNEKPDAQSVEEGDSKRRVLIFALLAVLIAGVCALFFLAYAWFQLNQTSLLAEHFPSRKPNLTATQQAWVKPAESPRFASAEDAREAYSSDVSHLWMIAPELPELGYQPDDVYIYNIQLLSSRPLIWSYVWCTTTQEILEDNFRFIQLEFTINETPASLENFAIIDHKGEDGSPCRTYAALVDVWTEGQHQFESRVTFTESIHDGWDPYPAGTHTFKYNVNVVIPSTASVEAAQTITANIVNRWNMLLSETFDNHLHQWHEGAEDDGNAVITYKVTNGKYRWDMTARDYTIKRILITDPVSDFYFTTDIQYMGETGVEDAGVIYREDTDGNFYYFAVGGSQCALLQFYNGEWLDLIMQWTYCPSLVPNESNKLSVIAEGDQFTLLINDNLVGVFHDDLIQGNRIGLAIRAYSGTFEFDNLELMVP